ncbi:hypothetical protein PAMP_010957 [Pampus punctatissimus]
MLCGVEQVNQMQTQVRRYDRNRKKKCRPGAEVGSLEPGAETREAGPGLNLWVKSLWQGSIADKIRDMRHRPETETRNRADGTRWTKQGSEGTGGRANKTVRKNSERRTNVMNDFDTGDKQGGEGQMGSRLGG